MALEVYGSSDLIERDIEAYLEQHENKSLLRSSVSAAHTPEQIDAVLDIFERLGLEYGLLQRPHRASA